VPGRPADRRPRFAPQLTPAIRHATRADRAFIEALGQRTVMSSVSTLRHPDPAAVLENFDRLLVYLDRQVHTALIAEAEGVPVGFMLVVESLPDEVTGEDQAFIAYTAVEPDRQGAGIGAALLAWAEDEARRRGAPYMSLMVTEENAAARALYERAGYRTERRLLCKTL
jgi:ribosomal protein S18 acetylase RimI-like enzyme